jgi:hypothetical protein
MAQMACAMAGTAAVNTMKPENFEVGAKYPTLNLSSPNLALALSDFKMLCQSVRLAEQAAL